MLVRRRHWRDGLQSILGRIGWSVGDQAVSSLSNFLMSIFVVRALGPVDFGSFSLAYVTYAVVLNAARGLGTDPLLVRHSGPANAEWRRAVAAATATATVVGAVIGALCLALAPLMHTSVRDAFIALAVCLPGLMLQDSWRFTFFSTGQAHRAVVNDLVWGLLQLAMLVALTLSDRAGVVSCMLAFGASATAASLFGLWQSRVVPDFSAVRPWLRRTRGLGSRYLVENVSQGAARQLRIFALGSFAGLAAVGEVRAAEMLMGPFLVVLMGMSQVAVPEGVRILKRAPRRLPHFCLALGVVEAMAAGTWGLIVLVVLPRGAGDLILGPIWASAAVLLPPVILGMMMGGLETGAAAGVRAVGAASRSLRAQLFGASLYVVGGSVGAWAGDAAGSCWGVAAATAIAAFVWWVQLRRALQAHAENFTGREWRPGQLKEVTS